MSISFHNLTTGSERAFIPECHYTKSISVDFGDKITISYNPTSDINNHGISKVEFYEISNNEHRLVQTERVPPYVISGNNGTNLKDWPYEFDQKRCIEIIIYDKQDRIISKGKFQIKFVRKTSCCHIL